MRRFRELATSLRTTAVLFVVLATLLLLNVLLPQREVIGESAFRSVTERSVASRLFLVHLGLGQLPTSPPFLTVLGLFFVNLSAIVLLRARTTFRRIRTPVPRPEELDRLASGRGVLERPLPVGWTAASAVAVLRGFGFRTARVGESALWGVRHRSAPLGFLLFHGSFFVLCSGGVLLWATRFSGKVRLVEGQRFEGELQRVIRKPPWGGISDLRFAVVAVDPKFERDEPTDLAATVRFGIAGGGEEQTSRVNHPARWGSFSVLVTEAGVAPELWIQTPDGFTLDRVSVASNTRGTEPTDLPLARGRLTGRIDPLWPRKGFPDRHALEALPMRISLREGATELWRGELRPGEAREAGGVVVRLVRHRYWVGILLVSERGGGLLTIGFCMAVVGLLWRLAFARREVAVFWDSHSIRVVGKTELLPERFGAELESIADALALRSAAGVEFPGKPG